MTDIAPAKRLLRESLRYKGHLGTGLFFGMLAGASGFGLLRGLEASVHKVFTLAEQSAWVVVSGSLAILLFFAVRGLAGYVSTYFINWVGLRVVQDLRTRCFAKLQKLHVGFFNDRSSGDLISRVTNDTSLVQAAVSSVVADLVQQPFALAACLVYLIRTDWVLALISLVVFPLVVAPVVILGRRVRRYSRQSQERLAGLVSILQENVSGARVVRAFGMEAYEEAKFHEENHRVFSRLIRIVLARNVNQPLMEIVAALGIVSCLVYAARSDMEVSAFMGFVAALTMMYEPAKRLGRLHMEIQKSVGAAERVFQLLDTDSEVLEKPGAHVFDEPLENLTFENVSFQYGDTPVLRDVNLHIRSGEKIALVGSSGSGKTTLVNLVGRFYDPTAGRLLLNQHDLRDLTLASLRRRIALVTQDTFLFNDTIAANISYGRHPVDMDRVRDAARRAHADRFIEEQPQGYDTLVGERGVRLSGGQRQRLAIARAIFHDAPLLILDEATSALDNESERHVQAAIDEVMQGRTVIAIAHRLSTIQHSDRILVLQEGRVVEEGTHATLLAQSGVYRYLYDLQFKT